MKIALFNDTGNSPHAGCQAVSNAHALMLGRAGHKVVHREFVLDHRGHWTGEPKTSIKSVLSDEALMEKIDAADTVIVNGEGTIHHGFGYHLLAILGAAQTLRKQTLLVNAVFQDTEGFDDVLHRLHDFTLRENYSLHHAQERGFRCRLVWDSSLAADYQDSPLYNFSNQTIVTDWHGARNQDTGCTALKFLSKNTDTSYFLPLQSQSAYSTWQRMPATFATADLILSGRHHANYFAAKAGVPFICMPSNTHKVEGFIDLLGEDIPFISNISQLDEAYEHISSKAEMFKRIKGKIENMRPLAVFNRLGSAKDSTQLAELKQLEADITRARHKMTKRHIGPFDNINSAVKQALAL